LKGLRDYIKELSELKRHYNEAINQNVKLQDEAIWAKKDAERYKRKIERALEMIENNYSIELIKQVLTEDYVEE
jgi:phage shock protein A